MSHILVGTAALAVVGRAYAETPVAGSSTAGSPSSTPTAGTGTGCGNCAFYTPSTSGERSGTCAFAGGKSVSADDGCEHFTQQ